MERDWLRLFNASTHPAGALAAFARYEQQIFSCYIRPKMYLVLRAEVLNL